MKKYPVILILAAFLVGCNTSSSEESLISSAPKEESSVITINSSSNTAISSTIISSSETISSSDALSSSIAGPITSDDHHDDSRPVPVGYWEKKVDFLNGGFTNSTLDQKASQDQFVDWFNGDEDKILDSIEYSGYLQMNYIGNEGDANRFSTLILGSQNSDGKLTFNFNVTVITVRVVVQAYSKYIAYNDTYSTDANATFIADETEYDLSLEEDHTGDTEKVNLEWGYEKGTKVLSISNKDPKQRVFVHSITIGHWGM